MEFYYLTKSKLISELDFDHNHGQIENVGNCCQVPIPELLSIYVPESWYENAIYKVHQLS